MLRFVRTLVVVVGVLACAVRPCSARAQSPTGWDMALTGGFVASGLVDPVFALGNVGQPARVVVREHDQESTVNLNVAMFAQIITTGGRVAPIRSALASRRFARRCSWGRRCISARTRRSLAASPSAPSTRCRPGR
jgi:hypothetical protein